MSTRRRLPRRSVLTPAAVVRLLLGWGSVASLTVAGSGLAPPVPAPLLVALLVGIVGVIVACAFGVVHEAEQLARRLGDPYGSLVLTLSVVCIEVALITAVMLGPGDHATIARDSVLAVSMIVLNAVVGLCLLVGGLRHGGLIHNRAGTSAYLAMLVVLSTLGLALPRLTGRDGQYPPGQAVPVAVATLGLYAFFLLRQTGPQAGDFVEVDPRAASAAADDPAPAPGARREPLARFAVLVATVLPVVLLAHHLAALLDDGFARIGAPPALTGVLIALIVFLPESITAVRAALGGEIQRVSNLCHGGLVSTVGVTVPAVLIVGLLTGRPVILGETPAHLLLLGVTLLLTTATFSAPRVTATHGAVHLAVFAVYGVTLLA